MSQAAGTNGNDAERVTETTSLSSQAAPPAGEVPVPELLRTLLATRSLPCPVCHYNLRGCDQPKCPECGTTLGLSVGSPQVVRFKWLPLAVLALIAVSEILILGQYAAFFINNGLAQLSSSVHAVRVGCCALVFAFSCFYLRPAWSVMLGRGDVNAAGRTVSTVIFLLTAAILLAGLIETGLRALHVY